MPSDARPNILFIMTDQQRSDCLSIDGHPCLETPNMDALAGSGVRFSSAYSTCPSCIAARRSLLSGQFPATHGMVGYRDGVEWDAPPTLPGALRDAGYHTFLVGRDMHQHPSRKRYGFDHMVTTADYTEFLDREAPNAGGFFGQGIMHNDWTAAPWELPTELTFTNWITSQAQKFADVHDPSGPYFLAVSYAAPHPPLQPPRFYFERYLRAELPEPFIGDWTEPPESGGLGDSVDTGSVDLTGERLRSAQAGYFGLINHVDDQIRRFLHGLTGITRLGGRDTVIVFTSDHGEMLGDHYLWRKIVPYEGSARIPLIISAPERFGAKKRSVVEEPVCLEDLMPTLLDLADVPIPETVEGRSLLPLMRGAATEWREHLHVEHAPVHHTLTDGREKYIWWVRDGREQYFDLADDPNELHDLINSAAHQSRIDELRRRLVEELKDRPEGFSDGERLIPGCPYSPTLPHAGRTD